MTARITPARPLSRAEQRVAELVAEGLNNRQIAKQLFLSHRTVQSHVSHALAKLAIHSRVQLALHVQTAQYETARAAREALR